MDDANDIEYNVGKARYEELKARRAWTNPTLVDEYNRLREIFGKKPDAALPKVEIMKDSVPVPQSVGASQPETIEVPKDQLTAILEQLKQLQTERAEKKAGLQNSDEWKEVSTTEGPKKATLRVYKGKYVVDWKFSHKSWNENLQEMEWYYTNELLKDVNPDGSFITESVDLTLSQMAKLEREEVEIFDKEVKVLERNYGETPEAIVDYDHFRTTEGPMVPLKVVTKKYSFSVKLPDGRVIRLQSDRLNA